MSPEVVKKKPKLLPTPSNTSAKVSAIEREFFLLVAVGCVRVLLGVDSGRKLDHVVSAMRCIALDEVPLMCTCTTVCLLRYDC